MYFCIHLMHTINKITSDVVYSFLCLNITLFNKDKVIYSTKRGG